MKFSIITVCKNAEDTIAKTLHSVTTQTYLDSEHIVIDGASTDGTIDIIKKKGKHLKHFISERDEGIYDAMNKGLRLAKGDIVAFLNADDHYADKDVLQRVATHILEANLDVAFADVGIFNKNRPDVIVRHYKSKHFSSKRLAWGWMPPHPTLFVKRELYERLGFYRTDYRIAGDFEFIIRLFQNVDIKYRYMDDILVLMTSRGMSSNGIKSKIILNREVLRACIDNGIQTNMFKILCKYPRKILEYF